MADIYYFHDDDQEDSDTGYGDSTEGHSDDFLPAVQKLEKYSDSENVFDRQIVARTLLDTLRTVVDLSELDTSGTSEGNTAETSKEGENDEEAAEKKETSDSEDDLKSVLGVLDRLSDDAEASVRAELMEQIPHIAMFCQEYEAKTSVPAAIAESLRRVVPDRLLPMVVKFLTDTQAAVRKTSQAALLVLLEQGLVERSDVEAQVCPVIIKLTEPSSWDDYRGESVALLCKMAPLIGTEVVKSVFLGLFIQLCKDPLFHVRKVCAANFGDFASVVGNEHTEKDLLPQFLNLCEDGVWGVRKACAEVLMSVSCVVSLPYRHNSLAPVFIALLRDQSRWVRMAAFQALGPFISTFCDKSIITALKHNDGDLKVRDHVALTTLLEEIETKRDKEENERREKENSMDIEKDSEDEESESEEKSSEDSESLEADLEQRLVIAEPKEGEADVSFEERRMADRMKDVQESETTKAKVEKEPPSEESYNDFNYWREPLVLPPELDLEKESEEEKAEEKKDDKKDGDANAGEIYQTSSTSTSASSAQSSTTSTTTPSTTTTATTTEKPLNKSNSTFDASFWDVLRQQPATSATSNTQAQAQPKPEEFNDPTLPKDPPPVEQRVVPQTLIDYFISMTDPSRAQTVDSDIVKHCAFSLPAVAITLGRSNWPLLKPTYAILASDMQWKVRRSLASSIHEVAVVLGESLATKDLIPIFDGFLKDLDEVRIALLKNLAEFLRLFGKENRKKYLPRLSDFLKMDNDRNWRFRLELTEQLTALIPLYDAADVEEYIAPIAMVLIRDKVSCVREAAVQVVASLIGRLRRSGNEEMAKSLIQCAVVTLAQDRHWVYRQTFAALCQRLRSPVEPDEYPDEETEEEAEDSKSHHISNETFVLELLPHLLYLAEDAVPNVRLCVARTLSELGKPETTSEAETTEPTTSLDKTYDVSKDTETSSMVSFLHSSETNPYVDKLKETEENLKNDKDVDVRMFFGGAAKVYPAFSSDNEEEDEEEAEEGEEASTTNSSLEKTMELTSGGLDDEDVDKEEEEEEEETAKGEEKEEAKESNEEEKETNSEKE